MLDLSSLSAMSIAVSAIVQPSRMLLAMVGGMSLLVLALGMATGTGTLGELSIRMRLPLGVLCIFLGVFGFYHYLRRRKILHMNISGTGLIYVKEVAPGETCMDDDWPHVKKHGQMMRLRADSTIWPSLLLLRLQDEDGKIMTVPVFFDSVSFEDFRALSVACRWIAARSQPPGFDI